MTAMIKHLWKLAPTRRTVLILLLHTFAFTVAYVASYLLSLRVVEFYDSYFKQLIWTTLPMVLGIKLLVFYFQGDWKRGWRYATFSDLSSLLRAATLASLIIATLDMLALGYNIPNIPRRVLVLDWMLTVFTLGGLRVMWRMSREGFRALVLKQGCRKALIVGANPSGESLARQFLHDDGLNYFAVGFLDDDATKYGTRLSGVPIAGSPEDAVEIARHRSAEHILVISGTLSGGRLRKLMASCQAAEIPLKVIPAMDDLLSGDFSAQFRDVDINDLLRREPVQLSDQAIRALVERRVVMITGSGGSIGSEICRQVLKFRPQKLLLVERAENNLFHVEREFQALTLDTEIVPCLADVGDRERIEQIYEMHRPNVVFHAAAHKHVPMMEVNPGEAIKNNVLSTMQLAELADAYGVDEFVLISTDKSVNPTSIMGASKQLAERFVHAFSDAATTKFVVVRFGNVLASAGSVVPIFQEQIRAGGPVTVTHPQMERFFMTIPEASQLVLQAAAMGRGGEIFVLDMGEPVRIVDLAQDLIRLSGLDDDAIEIRFTGLRPGEKLFEELYFADEERLPTPHPKLFVAYHRPYELAEVRRAIAELRTFVHEPPERLRAKIKELVPEYQLPSSATDADSENTTASSAASTNGSHIADRRILPTSDPSLS
jgi:FlaA1/EpsC-like NDP-sugar epimerase